MKVLAPQIPHKHQAVQPSHSNYLLTINTIWVILHTMTKCRNPGTPPVVLSTKTFDPTAYNWNPAPRQQRSNSWTVEKQRSFIEALADTGSVKHAARSVDMSTMSCYRLRRTPGAEGFAAAWDAAIAEAARQLVDIAFDRAINGVEHHVIDKHGNHIYTHDKVNDRLLMFLLRAHHPERYGRAQSVAEPLPIAAALERLEPDVPAEPQLLMAPEVTNPLVAEPVETVRGDAYFRSLEQSTAEAAQKPPKRRTLV